MVDELVPQLSQDDEAVLREVLVDDSASLEVAIPAEIDPQVLWRNLETCCRIFSKTNKALNKLKPVIGRLLVILQQHPDVYQQLGYRTYDEWMSSGMDAYFGISRTESYALRAQIQKNPSLAPEEYVQIGPTKMACMSTHITEGEPGYEEVKEFAKQKEVTKAKLLEKIAEVKGIERSGTVLVDVILSMTIEQREVLYQLLNDRYVHLYVGSTSPGRILELMIGECIAAWIQGGMQLEEAGGTMPVEESVF